MSKHNIPLLYRWSKTSLNLHCLLPELTRWLFLCGSNYPCPEQFSMVPKMFGPMKFDRNLFTLLQLFLVRKGKHILLHHCIKQWGWATRSTIISYGPPSSYDLPPLCSYVGGFIKWQLFWNCVLHLFFPASILYKSISARYRFIKNAYWVVLVPREGYASWL